MPNAYVRYPIGITGYVRVRATPEQHADAERHLTLVKVALQQHGVRGVEAVLGKVEEDE